MMEVLLVAAAAMSGTPVLRAPGQPSQVALRSRVALPPRQLPVSMALDVGEAPLSMSPVKAHDLFNLAATTALTGLTCASHFSDPSWNEPLAALMCGYLAADSIWLVAQPEIAGSGGEGASSTTSSGGALTLLSHHAFALVVAAHALTWVAHTHHTCEMTVVEVNTLILMLERQLPEGSPIASFVHMLFVGSWVVLRLLWFPYLAAQLAFLSDYPSDGIHLACAASLLALTVHQLLWTWNFCVPEEKWVPLP